MATYSLNKKYFCAHYMTAGLRSFSAPGLTETTDFYGAAYLTPTGESNAHIAYGGFSRDRPKFDPTRTVVPGVDWNIIDAQYECETAASFGLDGFAMLMPYHTGVHITRMNNMWAGLQRSSVAGSFFFKLMPDCAMFIGVPPTTDDQFIELIKTYAAKPGTMKLDDGRTVLQPYQPEKKTIAWWQAIIAKMNTTTTNADGTTSGPLKVAFIPVCVGFGSITADQWLAMPETVGLGYWGSRNPNDNNPANNSQISFASKCHAAGKIWVGPVSGQDVRPHSYVYNEALDGKTLENTFKIADQVNSDWIDYETWNDPAEMSGLYISRNAGDTKLQLSKRFVTNWRNGTNWPNDDFAAVLTKTQFKGATYSYTSPDSSKPYKLMSITGSTPASDSGGVLTWLKEPASVVVKAGGNQVLAYTAPAGYHREQFTIAAGRITVEFTRNSITDILDSNATVTTTPLVQDPTYYGNNKILALPLAGTGGGGSGGTDVNNPNPSTNDVIVLDTTYNNITVKP